MGRQDGEEVDGRAEPAFAELGPWYVPFCKRCAAVERMRQACNWRRCVISGLCIGDTLIEVGDGRCGGNCKKGKD